MDIPSLPPTEPASPTEYQQHPTTVIQEEPPKSPERTDDMDGSERHAGLGSLMKTAKQDVSVPEFDMNAFF
jgi:rabconnectin-3a